MKQKKYLYTIGIILIAVVVVTLGLSYAYFVADVEGSGNESDNTSDITTVSLGEIKYEGDLIFNANKIYPGYKGIQTFVIKPDEQNGTGIYEIDLEASIPEVFNDDIEITLYKSTDPTNNYLTREEGKLIQIDEKITKEDTINITGDLELVFGPEAITESKQIVLEQVDFVVPSLLETTYYLVYHYKNNGNQDAQQGQIFNGKISVRYVLEKLKPYATKYITTLKETADPSLVYDNTVDNNLRYIGANPNNYVQFNNELWRIIGVMNNIDDGKGNKASRLKIIRSENIGRFSWDSSPSSINYGRGVNEWSQADLNILLNDFYYNAKSNQVCYNGENNATVACDFSSNGLKDSSSKAMIDTVVWNTGTEGTLSYSSLNASSIYNLERSENTGKICNSGTYCTDSVIRTTSWSGKIGLIYSSDYAYATSGGTSVNRTTCLNYAVNKWNSYNDCFKNSWILKNNTTTISPSFFSDTLPIKNFYISSIGRYEAANAADALGYILPVVYLKNKVRIIDGAGTQSNPYILSF